jgi:hypothetical protein
MIAERRHRLLKIILIDWPRNRRMTRPAPAPHRRRSRSRVGDAQPGSAVAASPFLAMVAPEPLADQRESSPRATRKLTSSTI